MARAVQQRRLTLSRPREYGGNENILVQALSRPCPLGDTTNGGISQLPRLSDIGLLETRRQKVQAALDRSQIPWKPLARDIAPLLGLVELSEIVRSKEQSRQNRIGVRE